MNYSHKISTLPTSTNNELGINERRFLQVNQPSQVNVDPYLIAAICLVYIIFSSKLPVQLLNHILPINKPFVYHGVALGVFAIVVILLQNRQLLFK